MTRNLLLALMTMGCSPSEPLSDNQQRNAAGAGSTREKPVGSEDDEHAVPGEGIANLPFAHGRTFRTLDEYLAHLERYARPIDQPWWREVSPGIYEHMKRMPGAPREVATRAELIQRFGFTE